MRRARNAQAYADADYRTRDGWRETAAAYAIAARRHNWQLVRALRNFR